MSNYTDDQLRQLAERLAVEVCGWRMEIAHDRQYEGHGNFIVLDYVMYVNRDNTEIYYVEDWRPWERLEQAWMVKDALFVPKSMDTFNKRSTFVELFHGIPLLLLKSEQAARAIFDAACQAMEYNNE